MGCSTEPGSLGKVVGRIWKGRRVRSRYDGEDGKGLESSG